MDLQVEGRKEEEAIIDLKPESQNQVTSLR